MVSPATQSSLSLTVDQLETGSHSHSSLGGQTASESDLIIEYSFINKLKSGTEWLIGPFRRYCTSNSNDDQTSHPKFDSQCLKPRLNHVSGLLKYFTFGVMFTNGILGFIVFIIGLWSSFEHRKLTYIPTKETSASNPFNSLAIILCIFGLLFFVLCLISCLGINRENLNLLRISLFGQFVTLVIFLLLGIMILVWEDKFRQKIGRTMLMGLKTHYHIDEAWTAFFDKLQMTYFCCGVYSFDDWNENPNYECTSANILQSFDACSVPFTCCKTNHKESDLRVQMRSLSYKCGTNSLPLDNGTINMNEIQERLNINGCFDEILPVIQQLIVSAAVFLLLICVIIFITIFLTCTLTFQIRSTSWDVDRHCRKRKTAKHDTRRPRQDERF